MLGRKLGNYVLICHSCGIFQNSKVARHLALSDFAETDEHKHTYNSFVLFSNSNEVIFREKQ